MRTRRAVGAVVLALLAATVACGGDDDDTTTDDGTDTTADPGAETEADAEGDSGERDEYVAAIVALSEGEDVGISQDDIRCVAESYVDAYGAAEMAEAGITTEDITSGEYGGPGELGLDFSEDQGADFFDRLEGCMDVRGLMLESLSSGGELPAEAVDCLDENITDDLLERFFTTGFTEGDAGFEDNPELETEFEAATAPCMALSGP